MGTLPDFAGAQTAAAPSAEHLAAANGASTLTAHVQGFEVQGNTLLAPSLVAQALPATPATFTLTQLQAAAQALQAAYRAAGYGAVVVLLPQQTIGAQGRVQLMVVEGKLSAVHATGYTGFSRENVLRALPSLALGTTPHLASLDSELRMANENPAKSVRVVLQPGEQHSQVEALIAVEEQPLQRWQLGLDNTGNASTGRWRLSAFYQHANVADRDVVLGLRFVTSPTQPEQVLVLGSSLRVPLYGARTMVEGSLLVSNVRSSNNYTPAGELRFSGRGMAIGARSIWLLASLSEAKSQAALGLDVRSYRNDCTVGLLGRAGCGSAAASVDVMPLTASWSVQKIGSYALHISAVTNLPIGKAGKDEQFNASRAGARSHYRLARLQWSQQLQWRPQWLVHWRVEGQWSPHALVSAEQLGAGGASSLRGYQERESAGDSGVVASLELRTPLATFTGTAPERKSTMLSAFVDGAVLHNRAGATCDQQLRSRCSPWSAGFGMVLHPRHDTTLHLQLGRAGRAASQTERGEWRLHLSAVHAL